MAVKKELTDLQQKHTELQSEVIPAMQDLIQQARERRRIIGLLESVAHGVYDESDKLCKKAPAETVTELALEHVNHVIAETKAIANDDPFISRLTQFVAAGENPEQRDVVLVLRQIIQGLERASTAADASLEGVKTKIEMAEGLSTAIALKIETPTENVTHATLERYGARVPTRFLDAHGHRGAVFDFDLLSRTNLTAFFNVGK